MSTRGLGREQVHDAAWGEYYPHPLVSCMMPVIALLAVIALMLFGLQLWQLSLPRDTIIPPVEGLKLGQALTDLRHAGLSIEVVNQQETSETIPKGAVIYENPAAGRRVKMGRIVRLIVSAGSAYTTVPDVRELSQDVASDRLQQAGLVIATEEYQYHDAIPFDHVVSITPAPGERVKRMTTVDMVLSKGSEQQEEGAEPVMRTTVVTATLPATGTTPQDVRIDVTDDDGTRTVYQHQHAPGDKISETVQGTGQMTIEVYFGDQLILTKIF